jgi:predicted nucleotidyltransferase
MERKDFLELIESPVYDFLRTDPHVKDRMMLLTLGGSHAYGTNVCQMEVNEETGEEFLYESDVDLRGIVAEGKTEITGLSAFEQFENKATDTVLYSLRKIVSLMLNCNPNTVEILGTRPDQIFYISPEGKLLRDNVDIFLSRRAVHSFGGYANQQLRRLQNALARDSYPQTEKEKHIMNTINVQMQHLREHYAPFDDGAFNLYIDDAVTEDYEKEIFLDINLKHYPLRHFKNIFSEMGNVVSEYSKLGKRNKKKDELHLNKHAMHLIRLFLMGKEILEGKGINTFRAEDREFLLKIRNGEFPYEEVFAMVDKYEAEFQYAKDNSPLPDKPDYRVVEELVMHINDQLLLKYNHPKIYTVKNFIKRIF